MAIVLPGLIMSGIAMGLVMPSLSAAAVSRRPVDTKPRVAQSWCSPICSSAQTIAMHKK
jgi:hypothetical protein